MAKKDINEVGIHTEQTRRFPLDELMGDRFGKYAKYIIQDRALPDARDGLKPVQRRILYAMNEERNTYDKPYRKSAKTVGYVIGTYHPHGDTSVYDAMVRMSQDWKNGVTLIDMQGNNGSIDDDPAAAMRYTEARLSKISGELLKDIEKDTVLMAPNYDDTLLEPTVLPARFPNVLVNGSNGIAAGYATHIPPHNFNEIIQATIYRVKNPYCTLDDIMEIVKGPDFPTGGIVQGIEGIKDAFQTGKGQVIIRSKTEIIEGKTMNQILITEIPFEVVKQRLVSKMDDIRINKEIDGVLAIRDESGRDGLKIVIDIKKDANADAILNYFLKNTDLQVYYHYNVVAIVNKTPVRMGLIPLLDAYIQHREDVVIRRTRFDLDKKEKRCHILEGLIKAVSVLDEVIAIIRASKNKADSKNNLIKRFNFTDAQAEAIVTLQLYRLSSTDVKELKEEFKVLVNEMEYLQTILEDERVLHQVIIKELQEIDEAYQVPRRSIIEHKVSEITIDKMAMIASERVMVAITKAGYVKRVSLRSYNTTLGVVCGMKEGDELYAYREVDTLDTLVLFTNKGRYAYVPVHEIEECKWKEIGKHLSSVVKINGEEKIVGAICTNDFTSDAYVVLVTKNGMMKRTLIADYVVTRYNKPLTAINLKDGDEVLSARLAYESDEVILVSRNGYNVRYYMNNVSISGPKSAGVKAMNTSDEDEIGAMAINHIHKQMVVYVSSKGQMKRIRLNDLDYFNRPARGESIVKKVKTNPIHICDIWMCDSGESLPYVNEKDFMTYDLKDVPIMDKQATMSSCLEENQYLVHEIEFVEKRFKSISPLENIESGGDIQTSFDFDEFDDLN